MKQPYYDLRIFKQACKNNEVVALKSVLEDALKIFKIESQAQLLEYLCESIFDNCHFVNQRQLDSWKNKNRPAPIVDAYTFDYSASDRGYIAFYKVMDAAKWTIKSFHLDQSGMELRHRPLYNLLGLMRKE